MQQLFKTFGLNTKEIQTFLRLLELGAQPASVIAKHIGTPRSTMYLILDALKKAHLVEEFERAKIKYFKCIPVNNIPDVLKAREKELQHTFEIFQEHLPQLEALENKLSVTPKIKFFEGQSAVIQMYEQVLREKEKEFCAIFNTDLAKKLVPDYYYEIPIMLRAEKKEGREMVIDSPEGREYQKKNHSKYHQIKILPKNMVFNSDTILCLQKMYLISYGEREVCATEIWNTSLAETQKAFFEYLWRTV